MASIALRARWYPFPTTRLCSTVHLTQCDLASPLTLRALQPAFLRKEPLQSPRRQKQLITSSLPAIKGVNPSNTSPLSSKILVTPDPVGRALAWFLFQASFRFLRRHQSACACSLMVQFIFATP